MYLEFKSLNVYVHFQVLMLMQRHISSPDYDIALADCTLHPFFAHALKIK
jgi:hypothetical protein